MSDPGLGRPVDELDGVCKAYKEQSKKMRTSGFEPQTLSLVNKIFFNSVKGLSTLCCYEIRRPVYRRIRQIQMENSWKGLFLTNNFEILYFIIFLLMRGYK